MGATMRRIQLGRLARAGLATFAGLALGVGLAVVGGASGAHAASGDGVPCKEYTKGVVVAKCFKGDPLETVKFWTKPLADSKGKTVCIADKKATRAEEKQCGKRDHRPINRMECAKPAPMPGVKVEKDGSTTIVDTNGDTGTFGTGSSAPISGIDPSASDGGIDAQPDPKNSPDWDYVDKAEKACKKVAPDTTDTPDNDDDDAPETDE